MLAEQLLCSIPCLSTFYIEHIWYVDNIYGIKIKVYEIILEFSQDVNHYVCMCSTVSSSEGRGVGNEDMDGTQVG